MPQKILPVDNGSLIPAANLELKRLAHELIHQSGLAVDAVSLWHTDKIDAVQLEAKRVLVFTS